jgi:hypothetical protein
MNPMTIRRNTSMATKRVAFRHALSLRCAGINGIVLSATACSPVRLTFPLSGREASNASPRSVGARCWAAVCH